MAALAAGQVVVVRFPFSDLSASKLRPALVLAEAGRDDWILCQKPASRMVILKRSSWTPGDFAHGSLRFMSYARPGKLFTAHLSLVGGQVGHLRGGRFDAIRSAVVHIIQKS